MNNDSNQDRNSSHKLTETLTIVGKLTVVPDISIKCGDLAIATVFKFAVVQVLKGSYPHNFILIIIPCPDQNDEGLFVKNHIYTIKAATTFDDADVYDLQDDYAALDLPRYWGLEIKPQ